MNRGRIYEWIPASDHPLGGGVGLTTRLLPRLEETTSRLSGRYVHVRGGGMLPERDHGAECVRAVPIGDARPDAEGDFLFEPAGGGGRLDQEALPDAGLRERYIQAAHFGEVNAYYHLDRIGAYVDGLLEELEAPSLPRVTAVINAHDAAVEIEGRRDGVCRKGRVVAFQGGHYRLPNRRGYAIVRGREVSEWQPIAAKAEIHLGPGRQLLRHGALVEAAGAPYHANASHNGGILYHEYGHHLTRHTADFRANALRPVDHQDNRKVALDEGTCDYWAAVMLESPHIWAWHRRHDAEELDPRSLVSPKTMADFNEESDADPHANGTIWAAALWDLRCQMAAEEAHGARAADRLVVQMLLNIGREFGRPDEGTAVHSARRARESFAGGLAALLRADRMLSGSRHAPMIRELFRRRGIPLAAEPGDQPLMADTRGCFGLADAQPLARACR